MSEAWAVIFDMDGVLVDSYDAHLQSWVQTAKHYGRKISEADFRRTFGRTARDVINEVWGSGTLSEREIHNFEERKEEIYRQIIQKHFPEMPGAAELVRAIDGAGGRLALGSSGPIENVHFVLDHLGCRELFKVIVNGKDVTHGKPDPEVFITAAQRLGISPSRCVVMEDAPVGVAAAKAGGMHAIGIVSGDGNAASLAAADRVVTSLFDVTPAKVLEVLDL